MTKHFDVVHTMSGGLLGFISLKHPEWFFISNVSSHGGTRVPRATAAEAMPRWAKRMGCEMVARD